MEGLLHYINPAHAISLLSSLNEDRLKGKLCDVLLIVGDQKYRAHKNVLAASSEYFQSLFAEKKNESQTVFQLDFCEADAFDNVLNYIYSSSLFVEKGSLAAVQELGYSLGISFLTNILSKSPQAPFSSCSSKKTIIKEEDESESQQRSVIVCQNINEQSQNREISHVQRDIHQSSKHSSYGNTATLKHNMRLSGLLNSLPSDRKWLSSSHSLDDQNLGEWINRNKFSQQKNSAKECKDFQPSSSGSEMLKKQIMSQSSPESYSKQKGRNENIQCKLDENNMRYYSKLGMLVPPTKSTSQTIDRSGPLVKSLLRRSLSMDSQIPTYSHSTERQTLQESSIKGTSKEEEVSMVSQTPAAEEKVGIRDQSPKARRRTVLDNNIHIKTEPSSPVSERSEIIQVTVGDGSQAKSRDLHIKVEESPDLEAAELNSLPAKRKFESDRRTLPCRRVKMKTNSCPNRDANLEQESADLENFDDIPDSDDSDEMYSDSQGSRQKKICKHCFKIFRSYAGLHRHINMYHNPEKPYSCDICHKRFHTNFKVWTHCQTQHGIIKHPLPSSSSPGVLDEKFQRKLIDIVREREIKKALMFRLRRGKSGFQGSSSQAHALKRSLRSRNKGAYVCSYCGKSYRFLSQFKQHSKMHLSDKSFVNREIRPKEHSPPKNTSETKDGLHCRICTAKMMTSGELANHERMCRNATICTYCSLRFPSPSLKIEHEIKCEYKKLTCLECMRTFKSSFSIWRHQVEVHNQNTMTPTENFSLPLIDQNGEVSNVSISPSLPESSKKNNLLKLKDELVFSDSSEQMNFDSDESDCHPEDLSISKQFNVKIKEEPEDDMDDSPETNFDNKDAISDSEGGMWPCEKCGKLFTVRKQLERHQELLCSVKPFICHVCNKAFRTNFRLWSHFQSHMTQSVNSSFKEPEICAPVSSPSPPPPPPPPPLPKIQPIEPDIPVELPEKPTEKTFPPKESDSLFYHAPPLSALTFKRQFMCKLCHRTFKTAFSLWSHEQTHN
ncbi:zinc finger and BTB domain-containing protein 21 [Bombina bombina]|uniref:zinc finger and BTB domain-containing protein 21 n=1 Tax=Bombina bombina TaxID=8345 RepID=UPI00235AB10C|nr:zinc finger and BTB domain-containing protein 21 [Bombina bombina]XP_053561872.1 zinc finger and BTB domain-containing protein 21 [Bombina bombina]